MPNHITTVLTVTGDETAIAALVARHIAKVKDRDGAESDHLDFATIIPRPACVDATESGTEADAGFYALTGLVRTTFPSLAWNPMAAYEAQGFKIDRLTSNREFAAWLREHRPQVIAKGEASLRCLRETGYLNWHEWSIASWGTKWGAYSMAIRERAPGRFVAKFETAWDVPVPVLDALAKLYPALHFATESIDEGGGEYVGEWRAADNVASLVKVPDDAARYVRVYGRAPDSDEDERDAGEAVH